MKLQKQLTAFAQAHPEIVRLELFGSSVRGDSKADSDVDLLVTFAPDAEITLFDLSALQEELESTLQKPVDLVTRRSVEQSRNPLRRERILNEAVAVYGR